MQSYIKRENAYFSENKRVFTSSPFVQREGRVKGLHDAGVEWVVVENFIWWCPHFFSPWSASTKTSWWISGSEPKDAKEEFQRDKWGKKNNNLVIYFLSLIQFILSPLFILFHFPLCASIKHRSWVPWIDWLPEKLSWCPPCSDWNINSNDYNNNQRSHIFK